MKNIAIFASGNGSNAENIIRFFNSHTSDGKINLVICNRPNAGVIERARRLGVDCVVLSKEQINDDSIILPLLKNYDIDIIVLAGFLLLVPEFIISKFENRIVNIHPALLPKYGGKGMYGHHVHEAVVSAREKETGITIHYVNGKYDSGDVIFQAKVDLTSEDTVADVEAKIHELEQTHFPQVIFDTFFK